MRRHTPSQLRLEMNLVAVNHRLALLVRWHQRGKPPDGPFAVPDQDVAQLGRLHLPALHGRLPRLGARVGVVLLARLGHQLEASLELITPQIPRAREAKRVFLVCAWVRPCRSPRGRVPVAVPSRPAPLAEPGRPWKHRRLSILTPAFSGIPPRIGHQSCRLRRRSGRSGPGVVWASRRASVQVALQWDGNNVLGVFFALWTPLN